MSYEEDKKHIEKVILTLSDLKLQRIFDYIAMFRYKYYNKRATRNDYDELFDLILNIIKDNK